jgi:O-antigen/teichoic acid export membrane protein
VRYGDRVAMPGFWFRITRRGQWELCVSERVKRSSVALAAIGVSLRGAQAIVSLAGAILLARALGPASRGEYFLFVASVAVLTRVADLGLSSAAIVYASRGQTSRQGLHLALLRAIAYTSGAMLLPLVLLIGLLFVGPWPPPSWLPNHLWLALPILPLTIYEQVWIHFMVGLRRVLTMNLVSVSSGLVMVALIGGLVMWNDGGLETAIGIFVGVTTIKAVVMLLIALRATHQEGSEPVTEVGIGEVFAFGLRGYPNGLANLLWARVPVFVLNAVHGPTAVGIYSVAQQGFDQMLLPAQSTQDAIYQRIARLPRDKATPAMNRYLRTFVWFMLPIVVVSAIAAPRVIPLLFGEAFRDAVSIFEILLVAAALAVVPALLSPYFLGQLERPGLLSVVAWVRLALALAFAIPLVPAMGGIGLALALATAEACSTVITLGLYLRLARTRLSSATVPRLRDLTVMMGSARRGLHGQI